MTISVNSIPSRNVPFTDKEGHIHPIWHEFLRKFVAETVSGEISGATATTSVAAGAGLTGGGAGDITLTVGAGAGITVNADDVNVDIANQTYAQVTLEDDVMFSDISDNNGIRKTKVRDMAALASNPGGISSQMQYNISGVFGGDSGFTTDGAGNVDITGSLGVGGVTILEGAVETIHFDATSGSTSARIQSSGGGGYTLHAGAAGSDTGSLAFNSSGPPWVNWGFNNSSIAMADNTGMLLSGPFPLRRSLISSLTASTTQTQGNGALTRDYNNITTVANANDTVTLPSALSGRFCIVRNTGANVLQVFPASGADLGNGANVPTTIQPGAHASWFAITSTLWHQTDVVRHSVAATITASTTQTQGQQPLTKDVNEISTVANANDAITMPTALAFSRTITIMNNGANTLQIFPASGDNLGAGVDTSVTLAAGANVRYTNFDATNWEAI